MVAMATMTVVTTTTATVANTAMAAVVSEMATVASNKGGNDGGRRRRVYILFYPVSLALRQKMVSSFWRSHVGICSTNLAQSENLEIVARIWHGCPDTRTSFFLI